jgi:hypothetical protein
LGRNCTEGRAYSRTSLLFHLQSVNKKSNGLFPHCATLLTYVKFLQFLLQGNQHQTRYYMKANVTPTLALLEGFESEAIESRGATDNIDFELVRDIAAVE